MISAACAIGALVLRSSLLAPGPERPLLVLDTERPPAAFRVPRRLPGVSAPLRQGPTRNLFAACPSLANELPGFFRPATDLDRAAAVAPIFDPGDKKLRPSSGPLYAIDAPVLARDGRTATVVVSFTCSGLCGAGQALAFRREHGRWVVDGDPRLLWVS